MTITVAVDLDNVVVDYVGEVCARYRSWYGRQFWPTDVTTWESLHDYVGWSFTDLMDFTQDAGVFATAPPMPGALGGLWELDRLEGVEWHFVTHRPEWSRKETVAWIAKHAAWVGEPRLTIMQGSKVEAGLDVYVDDAPHILEEVVAAGRTAIRYDRPWNRRPPTPGAISAIGWPDVVRIVAGLR